MRKRPSCAVSNGLVHSILPAAISSAPMPPLSEPEVGGFVVDRRAPEDSGGGRSFGAGPSPMTGPNTFMRHTSAPRLSGSSASTSPGLVTTMIRREPSRRVLSTGEAGMSQSGPTTFGQFSVRSIAAADEERIVLVNLIGPQHLAAYPCGAPSRRPTCRSRDRSSRRPCRNTRRAARDRLVGEFHTEPPAGPHCCTPSEFLCVGLGRSGHDMRQPHRLAGVGVESRDAAERLAAFVGRGRGAELFERRRSARRCGRCDTSARP